VNAELNLKKAIAAGLPLLAFASFTFGQGSVNVANSPSTLFRTNNFGNVGPALSAMGPWYYEVLTAPSTVTSVDPSLQQLLSAPWSDTGIQMTNTGLAGRESGGVGGAATANFWPAGQTNSFIIVGWNSLVGSNWAAAAGKLLGLGGLTYGMFIGATTVGFRQAGGVVGANTIPTASLFGSTVDAQGSPITGPTDLFTVPEPSSFALAGLGIAALTIFRRRK